jgi:hypothetical protein
MIDTLYRTSPIGADGDWELRPAGTGYVLRPRRQPPVQWLPAGTPSFPARERPAAGVAPVEPASRAGRATAAGWSFLEHPTTLGAVPVPGGFLVETRIDAAGVQVAGRPVAPRTLAELIAACRGRSAPRSGRPLVLLPMGEPPPAAAAALLVGGLADALGEQVITADADVAVAANGLLITAGTFYRWLPRRAASGAPPRPRRVEALGSVLPPRQGGIATPVREVRLYVVPDVPRNRSGAQPGPVLTPSGGTPGADTVGFEPVALTEAALALVRRPVPRPDPVLPPPRVTALPPVAVPAAEPASAAGRDVGTPVAPPPELGARPAGTGPDAGSATGAGPAGGDPFREDRDLRRVDVDPPDASAPVEVPVRGRAEVPVRGRAEVPAGSTMHAAPGAAPTSPGAPRAPAETMPRGSSVPPVPGGEASTAHRLRGGPVTPAPTGEAGAAHSGRARPDPAVAAADDDTGHLPRPATVTDDHRSVRSEAGRRAAERLDPAVDVVSGATGGSEAPPAVSGTVPAEAMTATVESSGTAASGTAASGTAASGTAASGQHAGPSALWLPDGDDAGQLAAGRVALRQVLDGRYDAHARVVAKILSEEPGLRAVARGAPDIAAGLVAVRAYLLDERHRVNAVLRAGADSADAGTDVEVLARMATFGLRRLPPVFGPVFGTAPDGTVAMDSYRPGTELIEPALVDVELTAGKPAEHGVEFAIWSVSARRLAGLGVRDGTALFPPGSRFGVLAVDDVDGGGPVRILLRDLGADRGRPTRTAGADGADRIVARLRETTRMAAAHPADASLRFPIGLADDGRPYRRPAGGTALYPPRPESE